jgi:hypothetical protein
MAALGDRVGEYVDLIRRLLGQDQTNLAAVVDSQPELPPRIAQRRVNGELTPFQVPESHDPPSLRFRHRAELLGLLASLLAFDPGLGDDTMHLVFSFLLPILNPWPAPAGAYVRNGQLFAPTELTRRLVTAIETAFRPGTRSAKRLVRAELDARDQLISLQAEAALILGALARRTRCTLTQLDKWRCTLVHARDARGPGPRRPLVRNVLRLPR